MSAASARRLIEAFGDIDVSAELSQVRAPSLVVHARDDSLMRFEQAERLVAGIPNSRLVALDSRNHILLDHEPAWALYWTEVHAFLAGVSPGAGTLFDDSV